MRFIKRYIDIEAKVVHEIVYDAPISENTRFCPVCGISCGEENLCMVCQSNTVSVKQFLCHMRNWRFKHKGKLDITHIKGLYEQLLAKGFLDLRIQGSKVYFEGKEIDCDHQGNPEVLVKGNSNETKV